MRSLEELLAPSEEEWDEMVNNFTDEELSEYFRDYYEAFAQNPETSPATCVSGRPVRRALC